MVHTNVARCIGSELECASNVSISWVGVVEDDIVASSTVYRTLRNRSVNKHVVETQEVLDIGEAEHRLSGDVLIGKVVCNIERVYKINQIRFCYIVIFKENLELTPGLS